MYIISETWWNDYEKYISLDDEANFPGPIKNKELLAKDHDGIEFLTGDRKARNINRRVFDTFLKHDAPLIAMS